jgi:hypothetical protein
MGAPRHGGIPEFNRLERRERLALLKRQPAAPPEPAWTGRRWEYKSVTKATGELKELNDVGCAGMGACRRGGSTAAHNAGDPETPSRATQRNERRTGRETNGLSLEHQSKRGVCLMWDVLRWHNDTLSIAWWAMIGFAILVIIAAGARAAK